MQAERELPVVWAVAKGSLLNKAILVPLALAISQFLPWLVLPLLIFVLLTFLVPIGYMLKRSVEHDGFASSAPALVALLQDPAPRVRFQATLALGKLGEPTAVNPLLALAEREGTDPVVRNSLVVGLSGCARPEQLEALRSSPSPGSR